MVRVLLVGGFGGGWGLNVFSMGLGLRWEFGGVCCLFMWVDKDVMFCLSGGVSWEI